jgi:hypothetical protein
MSEFDDMPTIELGLYQHYKGNRYRVAGIGCHTEFHPHEYYVVYAPAEQKTEKFPDFWLRSYDMFVETVEVNGEVIPRFKKIDEQ